MILLFFVFMFIGYVYDIFVMILPMLLLYGFLAPIVIDQSRQYYSYKLDPKKGYNR